MCAGADGNLLIAEDGGVGTWEVCKAGRLYVGCITFLSHGPTWKWSQQNQDIRKRRKGQRIKLWFCTCTAHPALGNNWHQYEGRDFLWHPVFEVEAHLIKPHFMCEHTANWFIDVMTWKPNGDIWVTSTTMINQRLQIIWQTLPNNLEENLLSHKQQCPTESGSDCTHQSAFKPLLHLYSCYIMAQVP